MTSEDTREPEKPTNNPSDAEELGQKKLSQVQRSADIDSEDKSIITKTTFEEKLSSKMFTYARETICFFLAIAFTALAALHSSPPKISKPPVARPFFNETSQVLDFYKGHINALVNRVTESDFSFVMYYAPWDAECQATKEEFESAARYYHSQVFFAAINCWHPGSECRARYSKIQSYPVLMLYPAKESGVQYRGIKSAPYMIRFIHTFMNPIKRVNSDEQLMELLKSYDAVMIGYFNFTGLKKSPGYREFYRAALRTFERDPNGEIVFVAITNPKMSKDHGITHFPSASLLMWNETLFYSNNSEWIADNLSNWITNVIHRVVAWVQPPGSKALTFAPYLWDGPVLFLFTPRNPLHFENDNFNLLREIGLQYYDCSDNPQIHDLIYRLRENRLGAAVKASRKRETCMNILDEGKVSRSRLSASFAKNKTQYRKLNESSNCCSGIATNKCVVCMSRSNVFHNRRVGRKSNTCRNTDIFNLPFGIGQDRSRVHRSFSYLNRKKDNNICFKDSCSATTMTKGEIDPRSPLAVKKAFIKEDCRKYLAGYVYQRPIFPRVSKNKKDGKDAEIYLTDDICQINKTLTLVAIDSLHYFHFTESLGINIGKTKDKTVVVILDPADESQFVMKEDFTRNTLVQFINNYTKGYLTRTMRSKSTKRVVDSLSTNDEMNKNSKSQIYIHELSTETFLPVVLNPDKDVVVMYHSPYCAFCSAVAYVYLTVANYLSKMDHLDFVRIDGDNNDLPWEYTMNRFPSILFFPAKRKEDSTLFPWTLPVSVGNLLNYVLANLDEEPHIEALINVCATGAGGSSSSCLSRTRYLCLDVLEEHLKELRRLRRLQIVGEAKRLKTNRRRAVLLKLKHIREVHLILGSSKDLAKEKDTVKLLRQKFKQFYAKLEDFQSKKNIPKADHISSSKENMPKAEHISSSKEKHDT